MLNTGKSKMKKVSSIIDTINLLPNKTIIHIRYPVVEYNETIDNKNSLFIKIQLETLQTLAKICEKYDSGTGCQLPIIIGSMYDSVNENNKQDLLADTINTGFKSDYDHIARLRPDKLTELQFQILNIFKPVEILWYLGILHYGIPGIEKKDSLEIDKKYHENIQSVTIGGLGQLYSEKFENLNSMFGMADMALVKREREKGKKIKKTIKNYLSEHDCVIAIVNNMFNLDGFLMDNYKINIEIHNIN
jgi:hypothetical protein